MSERSKWKFLRDTATILEGAKKQLEHHRSRLSFWEDAKAKVVEKIKADGIDFSESIAERKMSYQSSNAYAGRAALQVQIKDEYQEDLDECHAKINQHRSHVLEYSSWVDYLSGPTTLQVEMDSDDHKFFFKTCATGEPNE